MIAPPATGIGVSLYHNCPYPAGFLTKISASSGMETDNVTMPPPSSEPKE
jgi:hypothetical protein